MIYVETITGGGFRVGRSTTDQIHSGRYGTLFGGHNGRPQSVTVTDNGSNKNFTIIRLICKQV